MFEFDKAKSASNRAKHGIDFVQAQALWDDPGLVEVQARTLEESRFLTIGLIKDKHWTAVVMYRAENIRIISVRRSRDGEVALYES